MGSRACGLGVMAVGLAGAMACSDGTGPGGGQRVGLMVSTVPAAAAVPGFAPESVKVGSHTLVFSKVELVLREIELRRVPGTAECAADASGPAASEGNDGKERDKERGGFVHRDCYEFEVGPLLLDLPLGSTPQRIVTIDVDTGSFRKVEFKIHRPARGGDDQAFLAAHPDLEGVSVRAFGTFDGEPFEFTSRVSAKQEYELEPPLEVGTAGATDLTLQVEVGSWFIAGGVGLIDPATAGEGGVNAPLVAQNIRRSFRVFEDRDRDGREDR
jgi:hypothetical protein